MEGHAQPRESSDSLRAAGWIPAFAVLLVVGVVLLWSAIMASFSWNDVPFTGRVWPPNLQNWDSLRLDGIGSSLMDSLGHMMASLLFAVPFSVATAYFLALKARPAVRRVGVFVLIFAWAMSVSRMIGFLWLAEGFPLAAALPWAQARQGEVVAAQVVAWIAVPPMTLSVFVALRGQILGLDWPSCGSTRLERFLREAVPRTIAGLAVGSVLAGAMLFAGGFYVSGLWGGGAPLASWAQRWVTMVLVPLSGVASTTMFTVILGSFVVSLVILWAVRRVSGRARTPLRIRSRSKADRTLSMTSLVVTGVISSITFYTLLLPLVIRIPFSFNSLPSPVEFEGFSSRWWTGSGEQVGILQDDAFLAALWSSFAGAAGMAALATVLAVLAAMSMRSLSLRRRIFLRSSFLFALVLPPALVGFMAAQWARITGAQGGTIDVFAWLAGLLFATGLAFICVEVVLRRAGAGPPVPVDWLRVSFLSACVVFLFAFNMPTPLDESISTTDYIQLIMARTVPTPRIDAMITLLAGISVVPLLAAWIAWFHWPRRNLIASRPSREARRTESRSSES